MAAIDKIYVHSWKEYQDFKDWCSKDYILDKYRKKVYLSKYLYSWTEEEVKEKESFPVYNAPCFVDAYIIRNCPFKYIQEALKINYGSDYDEIKSYRLYAKKSKCYLYGKHFKCIKHPKFKYNKSFKGSWHIRVKAPEGYMCYHFNFNTRRNKFINGTWDYIGDFVKADWELNFTTAKTIKNIKKKIIQWKLPIGSIVEVFSIRYNERYEFLIKK